MLYTLIIFLSFLTPIKIQEIVKEQQIRNDINIRFPPPIVVNSILDFQKARLDHLAFMIENGYGIKQDLLLEYEDQEQRYIIWDKIDSIQIYKYYTNTIDRDELLKELPKIIPAPYNSERFDDANK